jgi:hypothetical protein
LLDEPLLIRDKSQVRVIVLVTSGAQKNHFTSTRRLYLANWQDAIKKFGKA